MAARKPPSDAMIKLCAEVNARGRRVHKVWKDVTDTKVESWLQDELVPQPRRPGRGLGGGRSVDYGEAQIERLIEVADLVRVHRSADRVALVLFARGRPLPPERIRRGLLGHLRRTRADGEAAARRGQSKLEETDPDHYFDGIPTPEEKAEFAEPVVAARLQRDPLPGLSDQLRREAGGSGAGFQALARVTAGLTFGAPIPPDDAALVGRVLTGDASTVDQLEAANIDGLEEFVNAAAPDDFVRGLSNASRFFGLLSRFLNSVRDPEADGLRRWMDALRQSETEIDKACQVIFMLMMEQRSGQRIEPFLDELEALLLSPKE